MIPQMQALLTSARVLDTVVFGKGFLVGCYRSNRNLSASL
jgi:hypothetical protein